MSIQTDIQTLTTCVQLNDGRWMPRVALGTFQHKYDYASEQETVVNAVKSAFHAGYRHIDTAFIYGSERPIGVALNSLIRDGTAKRDELFITTKLWCNSHRREDVVPALRKSLEALGLEYVDLFLIHWPIAMQPGENLWPKDDGGKVIFADDSCPFTGTWEGMIECKKLGLAKSIGVSNFTIRQLQRLFNHNTGVTPAVNQVEVHVYFSNSELVDFCKSHGIQISCYCPLSKPYRAWAKEGEPFIATDATLIAVGTKYQKTPEQVALRYLLQRGLCVIPKSNSPEHQHSNISIFDFSLTDADIETIKTKCDRNLRVLTLIDLIGNSKEFPFSENA